MKCSRETVAASIACRVFKGARAHRLRRAGRKEGNYMTLGSIIQWWADAVWAFRGAIPEIPRYNSNLFYP